ncbi:MAG: hypothetical protein HWN66_21610 [Candidatus Helarchaeota archaeon]|nr:hypothetical protein [Candidatus Helarchaeota archaeon]
MRLKKSLNLIMHGIPVQKNVLCIQELKVFNTISKTLNNYLENLNRLSKGESLQKSMDDALNGEYFVIRFLKDVPQIIGTDLKRYGPFLVDDIAILPKDNVETLLKHQAVAIINKK